MKTFADFWKTFADFYKPFTEFLAKFSGTFIKPLRIFKQLLLIFLQHILHVVHMKFGKIDFLKFNIFDLSVHFIMKVEELEGTIIIFFSSRKF